MRLSVRQIVLHGLLAMMPGLIATFILLLLGDYDFLGWYTAIVLVGSPSIVFFYLFYTKASLPWQGIANMILALREGDFSIRFREHLGDDPISEAFRELNQLSTTLQQSRLNYNEANLLFLEIVQRINAAVFCFDKQRRLVLINNFAQVIIGFTSEKVIGRPSADLNLDFLFEAQPNTALSHDFPRRSGRWLISRGEYRQEGHNHTLIIVNDVGRPLREEELVAWRRLIRVLSHEINNSMTPLISLTGSLEKIVSKDPLPEDWREDLTDGLGIVSRRVSNLSRFIKEYSQLAKLPLPIRKKVELHAILQRVANLNPYPGIIFTGGPATVIEADEAQLEQLLINILKNAVEAVIETQGNVEILWKIRTTAVEIWIQDEGEGIANPDNLFVPFFTTKATGSGIGLVVSRQIAEAHQGSISLANRPDRSGCRVQITLPLNS
ncbi:MAG: ATP-binding protein [Verrucomicrobiota bacterium]